MRPPQKHSAKEEGTEVWYLSPPQSPHWDLPTSIPGGSLIKNPPANAGDAGDADLIPGLGRYPGVGNGNPLQYSFLENSMDRGHWWITVHGVAKSWTWLSMSYLILGLGTHSLFFPFGSGSNNSSSIAVGRIMTPSSPRDICPNTWDLWMWRGFADVIKLRIWNGEIILDYPGVAHIQGSLYISQNWIQIWESCAAGVEDGESGRKRREGGSLKSWKGPGTRFSPRDSGSAALPTPWF